jgi:hypothetical protein
MALMRALFRRELTSAGADYAELDTAEPLDRALALYLLRRKGRGRGR